MALLRRYVVPEDGLFPRTLYRTGGVVDGARPIQGLEDVPAPPAPIQAPTGGKLPTTGGPDRVTARPVQSTGPVSDTPDYGVPPNPGSVVPNPGSVVPNPPAPAPAPTPGQPPSQLPAPPTITAPQVPAAPPVATVDPATRGVQQDETVESRLGGLLTRGNPLLELAATRAQQQAAARGLLNSSIATEAGQAAVIQNALPIASQDAATFNKVLSENLNYLNQAAQLNATEQNRFGLQSQQIASDLQKLAMSGNIELQKQYLQSTYNLEEKRVEAQYQQLLRASASATQVYQQMQQNVANIMMNKDLDAAAKTRLVAEQVELTRGALRVIGSMAGDINLVSQLDDILKPGTNVAPPPPNIPPPPPPPLPPNDGGPIFGGN